MTIKQKIEWLCLLFSLIVLGAAPPVLADVNTPVCVQDVCFESTLKLDGAALPLAGVGLMRYYGFRLYVAALYAHKENASADEIVKPVAKTLVLHYLRTFSPDDFRESGRKFMQKNPTVDLPALEAQIAQMDALYQAVKEGDRYTLTFTPAADVSGDGATALILNGKELGKVKGNAFQAAYFGIWLSRYSAKESFTQSLFALPENVSR